MRTDSLLRNDAVSKPVVGKKYHLSWASSRGMVWELVSFDEYKDLAVLRTPKNKKILYSKVSALRETNKNSKFID